MPGFLREHLRPLAGSAGLHLVLLAVLAGAALRWTSSQPPAQLAIEGYGADAPPAARPAQRPAVEPRPEPERPVEPTPKPPEPVPAPPDRRLEEAAAAERAAELERERQAVEQAAQLRREKAEAERRAAEELERRQAAEAEARRKAAAEEAQRKAEEEARRKAEAEEAKRKAEAAAAREAKLRAEREAELQRRLAAEEETAALARSGVMDEYRALLIQTIERSWIRPASARPGLECTLYVTQAPGGTVVDVKLGPCNGDEAVRESITNAVYRASPLPAPRDQRIFERRLEIVFKPTE